MVFLFAIPALHAQVAPTRIGQHAMGETLKEWLAIEKFESPDAACSVEMIQKQERYEGECRRDKAAGIITTGDHNGPKQSKWKFVDQKLVSLTIVMPAYAGSYIEPDVPQELKFLIDAYGPPTHTEIVAYQNSYGAKWDCIQAFWDMPDATTIIAGESIRDTDRGPRRQLIVLFSPAAKEEIKPNPYKR